MHPRPSFRHPGLLLALLAFVLSGGVLARPATMVPSHAPVLTRFTTAQGLPLDGVNDVAQTRDGYLWVATFGGLARFDGLRFTLFPAA